MRTLHYFICLVVSACINTVFGRYMQLPTEIIVCTGCIVVPFCWCLWCVSRYFWLTYFDETEWQQD
jgi:hypothetical protein